MRDAARATSLLTADAIPACSAGTAASTVEVSGTGAPPASSASTWCRWSNSRLLDEPAGSGLDGRLPLDSAFLGPTSSPHVPGGDPLSGRRDVWAAEVQVKAGDLAVARAAPGREADLLDGNSWPVDGELPAFGSGMGPHPKEVRVTTPAGSVILFNSADLWHSGTFNYGPEPRLAVTRPAASISRPRRRRGPRPTGPARRAPVRGDAHRQGDGPVGD